MTARVQTNWRSTAGARPAVGEDPVGTLYVNLADRQIGVMDAGEAPSDLLAVRPFAETASYSSGDIVTVGGRFARANYAVAPGTFDAADWTYLDEFLPTAGGTVTGPIASPAPTTDDHLINRGWANTNLVTTAFLTENYVTEATADTIYAALSGATFTGPVAGPTPVEGTHLTTKAYVDDAVTAAGEGAAASGYTKTEADARFVGKAGATMTGSLLLHAKPTQNLQAATKNYVDDLLSANYLTANTIASTYLSQTDAASSYYSVQAADAAFFNKTAGGEISGDTTYTGLVTAANHLATKSYVDNASGTLPTGETMDERYMPRTELSSTFYTKSEANTRYVQLSTGGLFTAAVRTNLSPDQGNALTNKSYVDGQDNSFNQQRIEAEATLRSDFEADALELRTYLEGYADTAGDAKYVALTGSQTVGGAKTFTSPMTVNAGLSVSGQVQLTSSFPIRMTGDNAAILFDDGGTTRIKFRNAAGVTRAEVSYNEAQGTMEFTTYDNSDVLTSRYRSNRQTGEMSIGSKGKILLTSDKEVEIASQDIRLRTSQGILANKNASDNYFSSTTVDSYRTGDVGNW